MPRMPMTLTYDFKNVLFLSTSRTLYRNRHPQVKHCRATLKWQKRLFINIYLISLSVFRKKMSSHFNWLYYPNHLMATFLSWWMTLLIHRRNCHNPWKRSRSGDSLTLSALFHLFFSIYVTSLHLINVSLAFKADMYGLARWWMDTLI